MRVSLASSQFSCVNFLETQCTYVSFWCFVFLQMGSAISEAADGPVSSVESTGACQPETNKTTRTHLLCLSRAHNKFAIQLYQEFAKDGKRPGNFVICPISVSVGLGMLHLGSRGMSSEELHKVLYLQEVISEVFQQQPFR